MLPEELVPHLLLPTPYLPRLWYHCNRRLLSNPSSIPPSIHPWKSTTLQACTAANMHSKNKHFTFMTSHARSLLVPILLCDPL
ncbi:hypothetical protein E2C01_041460 [Portunus trituberculatus]|uniref:Uncharacterized protein n=1 Tax=Portunus trituberculatus TaxID=210409 RepID=A0A5B7FQG7_PORTR|nr:hypothetical protein [Portunus trituberculatus]